MNRVLVSILALSLLGCGHATFRHDFVDAELIVPRDDARSASVELETPGELIVRGGACSLVKARARYDAERTEAHTEFQIDEDGHGAVRIALRKKIAPIGDTSLDACVSTELPLRLSTTAGIGHTRMDLSGVQLRALDATNGTGDVDIDFGDASVAQAEMTVESGTGHITIDAKRVTWTGHNRLRIDSGTGGITLYLPRGVGITVDVDRGAGSLDVRGLDKDGERFVNALSASAENRLDVRIDAGVGAITIIAG